MKLIIKTELLKKITGTLAKIIGSGLGESTSGVYVEVSKEKVLFKTKQIDFGIRYETDVEKTEDGSVNIPIQALDGVVSTLIDASTEITLNEKKLNIKTNTSSSEIYILDKGEEPEIKQPDTPPSFSIRREVLTQGFKSVQHAAAESVVKPEIASVYLYTKNNSIYFVSTDAFRLAETRFLSEDEIKDDVEVIMPIKNVAKVMKVMDGVSDTLVEMYIQEGVIHLKTENALIHMNSVKGSFPDYKNIMPKEFDVDITILRGDITNFLKKARLFSNNLNRLSLSMEGDKTLKLEFSNEVVGTTTSSIPAVIKGNTSSLPSFNYKFISDALSVIPDDRVVLRAIDDGTKPMMIRGVEDTSFTAILSPLLEGSPSEPPK